jgi:lipoate-protein ligase A
LLLNAVTLGRPLLRIYNWAKPAVSIGYFQKFPSEIAAQGVDVVRRPTGGGLVDHRGDVTYTVVVPPSHFVAQLRAEESYNALHRCVVAAFKSLGMNATLSPHRCAPSPRSRDMVCFEKPTRYDVLLDGRKVAGAAQRRTKAGLLHQGSIWMGDDPAGAGSREKIMQALPRGFHEILGCQFVGYALEEEVASEARRLVDKRYGTREWNKNRR